MADRFYIGPINSGLQTNLKPFAVPDDAYASLNNAYVFRGRIVKRFGSTLLNGAVDPSVAQQYSRLRMQIGLIGGALTLPTALIGQLQIGQMFSVGDDMFTINQLGAGVLTLSTNPAITCTINNTASPNTVVFVGAVVGTPVYYYPSTPVMGLITYETAPINDEPTIAFDTQFAYQYSVITNGWERLGAAPGVWAGNDSQFFWGTTYRGTQSYQDLLFVSNFNSPDLMKYWDGLVWRNFNPVIDNVGNTILTARIIVSFKDRLLLLNTIEGAGNQFRNRCRFSQNGDATDVNAYNTSIPGRGGYIDASSKEAIIGAQIIKDRLIVFFERSTWELVWTQNQLVPFVWQQLNTELGVESTFSVVPFDKFALGVANVGIHACNGVNVERVDDKIPDYVFQIHNGNGGPLRVYGIRDYQTEMVYWAVPDPNYDQFGNPVYPNRVLVYNYKNGSWAFNDDSITCFGYFQPNDDRTWANTSAMWMELDEPWSAGTLQSKYRDIIAGNQEGYTFLVQPNITRNAPALQITNIGIAGNIYTLTVINHNLTEDDYIVIENSQGMNNFNNIVYAVNSVPDVNTITITSTIAAGVYTGGGTIARVSNINFTTKQYNFYQQQDRNMVVNLAEFLVDTTANGEITVDFYSSSSALSMTDEGTISGALIGTNILETSPYALAPLEATQSYVWHPVYLNAEGMSVQLSFYFSDLQIRNLDIAWSAFQLNAMIFHARGSTTRLR